MIEFIGYQRISFYEELVQLIVKFGNSEIQSIQKICLHAIVCISEVSLFDKYKSELLTMIEKGIQVVHSNTESDRIKSAATCALGSIIRYQPQCTNAATVAQWLSLLPLSDSNDNDTQISILCEIISATPQMILDADKSQMYKVLLLIGDDTSVKLREKICLCIRALRKDISKAAFDNTVCLLPDKAKNNIVKMMD
jgi:hypothetical protein